MLAYDCDHNFIWGDEGLYIIWVGGRIGFTADGGSPLGTFTWDGHHGAGPATPWYPGACLECRYDCDTLRASSSRDQLCCGHVGGGPMELIEDGAFCMSVRTAVTYAVWSVGACL